MTGSKKRYLWAFLLIALAYLILTFPPVGDDYNRLTSLDKGFRYVIFDIVQGYRRLNGRILGNAMSFFFMSRPMSLLAKSACLGGLALVLKKLLKAKSSYSSIVFMIMFLPIPVFREVVAWNAGFFNYVPVLVLILLSAYLIEKKKLTRMESFILFSSSLASGLFVENLTLYALIMPILAYFTLARGDKKSYFISFIGALLSNIIMFSSPVYFRISQGDDGYRTFDLANLIPRLEENWPVFRANLISLVFLIGFAFVLHMAIEKEGTKRAFFPLACLALIVIDKWLVFPVFVSMAIYISFYLGLLSLGKKKSGGLGLRVFSCLSMALAMGPLLVVSPVGARNFFTAQVFNYIIIAELCFGMEDKLREGLRGLLFALALLKALAMVYPSTVNYLDYKKMNRAVEDAVKEDRTELSLYYYSYPNLVHREDGTKIVRYYNEKYGKDLDIKLNFK